MALCTPLALLTLTWATSVPVAEGPVALRDLRSTAPAVSDAAEPSGDASPVAESVAAAPAPTQADINVALESGDLTTALELARSARVADPSPERWASEAAVLEQKGEWVAAIAAYREAANRSDPDARVAFEDRIAELDAPARGQVNDEPASQHAEALDEARAARELAANPPPPEPEPEPAPPPPEREKIVKKWYFWVTIAAVAASAGAITGIAIKSAVDEKKRSGVSPTAGPGATVLRF